MPKKTISQVSFLKNKINNSDKDQNYYPNFTLVDSRLKHLFKNMCMNFEKNTNYIAKTIDNNDTVIIDNQTGRIIPISNKKEQKHIQILKKGNQVSLTIHREKN